jgi:hypothetical protein
MATAKIPLLSVSSRALATRNPPENGEAQGVDDAANNATTSRAQRFRTDSFDRKMTGLLLIRTETLGFLGAFLACSIDFALFPPMFCFNAARDQIRFRQMDRGST